MAGDSSVKRLKVDLCIIGAGPAGLACGCRGKEEGIKEVLILERDREPGGILFQCIHNGFGLQYFGEDLTGPEYATRFINKARKLGVKIKLNTMVLSLTPQRKILAVNPQEGIIEIKARAVVLSMGCRERTRGALNIPGTRPSGIYTAGVAQRLVNMEGLLPGKEVVILGSGDIGLIMARRMTLAGAKVKAVVEILPYPSGLSRNVVQCLQDYGIPLLLSHTVVNIHGKERVEGVSIARVDKNLTPVAGTERYIKCDTLLLSVGLIPENELSREVGLELDELTGGPVVDEFRQTSLRGFFACGNVVQVYDLVDYVSLGGELAAQGVRLFLEGRLKRPWLKVNPGRNVRQVVPQKLSLSERGEIKIYLRVKKPEEGVRVKVYAQNKEIYSRGERKVRPGEMVILKLSEKKVEEISPFKEVLIGVEKRGA